MNDREILTAALRWHTAHIARLDIGAEQRRYQAASRRATGFGGADLDIGRRLTAAKRLELAALRSLAKVCANVRSSQRRISSPGVIDLPMLELANRFAHCLQNLPAMSE